MKKLIRTSVCMVALSVLGSTATPLLASPMQNRDQQRDQDRDRDRGMQHDQDRDRGMMNDRDRDRGDEAAYYNNKYYKSGWKDGEHHKHKDKKWKNDQDRMAYEAGYAHGDRGEQWQNPRHDRDHDHDHDHR